MRLRAELNALRFVMQERRYRFTVDVLVYPTIRVKILRLLCDTLILQSRILVLSLLIVKFIIMVDDNNYIYSELKFLRLNVGVSFFFLLTLGLIETHMKCKNKK